jgi:Domain of unknown function (DUF4037)
VRPLLDHDFPDFEHAAAVIGTGSEVLGYDDATSRDHHWGPRVQLFARDGSRAAAVEDRLADELPIEFAGFPTNFGEPDRSGSRLLVPVTEGPVAHRVEVLTLSDFLRGLLGVDPLERFTAADWLVTPTQRLLEVTSGAVFDDQIGDLTRARALLAWYPHDIWLIAMAGHWRRIAQCEHLHGRAGLRGDELGASLLGAALVHDAMRLGFLQHRAYPPYPKWFGTAYAALDLPEQNALETAQRATDWRERESAIVDACETIGRRHNALGITGHVDPTHRAFHDRPIRVLDADRFVDALRDAVADPAVEHLAGAIDAVSDNTDVLTRPSLWRELVGLYDRP